MPDGLERSAETVPLGPWRVKRVGYGAMQLAGDGVFGPPRDRDEALLVLKTAITGGIDHIDTAQFYGPGVVNQLIREALYPYPDELAIVSKVGARRDEFGAVLPLHEPDQLRRSIEENLATLNADRLAAVNLRLMDGAVPNERFDAQVDALVRAREEGLVDGVGLSNVTLTHLTRALDRTDIVCVQNLFNLADQRSRDVLEYCIDRNIAFVPFCPLGWPRGTRNRIMSSQIVTQVAARAGATPAMIALAWLLDLAPNILLIPGTRTRQHLAENLQVTKLQIDDQSRAQLQTFPALR
jgi:pyridoxine 4-dehydrogenase